jgi:serine/threonine-protein kinase
MLDVKLAGRYRLENEIGAGGMTVVWQAVDEVLERRVAVKILHRHLLSNELFCTVFRQESLSAGALLHPNIVSVYDTGHYDEVPFVVMEYLGGGSLGRLLAQETSLPPHRVAAIGADICDALAHAHRAGMVHRDLKPGNVLFSEAGALKVADFGMARGALGGDLTATGALIGTLSFVAPEVLEGGEPAAAADLYALGVILFRALTGRSPRPVGSEAAAGRKVQPPHPRDFRPDVPRDLDAAVSRALAPSPEERFADAAEMGRLLRSVTHARPARTPEPAPPARPTPPASPEGPSFVRTEGRWLAPVVLLILTAIAVSIGVLQLSGKVSIIPGTGSGNQPVAKPTGFQVILQPGGTLKPNASPGDDPNEHGNLVANAFDTNGSAPWNTQSYFSESFGGLRPGVGIFGDAGKPTALRRIEVDTSLPGWQGTIRWSDDGQTWSDPGPSEPVDAQHDFSVSGSHRYWMVWITKLVQSGGGFQASINHIKAFS